MRAQHQERRTLGLGHRLADGGLEGVEVVGDLAEFDHVPAVGAEPFADVVVRGEVGRTVDGDVVVVEEADQVAEAEMARQRGGLVADAFHHAAVAGDDERVVLLGVLAEADAQVTFGDRHADRVGEPLPERPGGDLDADGVARLGVSRGLRAPLPELAQVVEFEAVAGEEEHRVLQDRRVAVRQDEPVAIGPGGVAGVVTHDAAEQDVGEGSERHRRALVPAVGGEWRIHRHATGERDDLGILFGGQRHAEDSTRRDIHAIGSPFLRNSRADGAPSARSAQNFGFPVNRPGAGA